MIDINPLLEKYILDHTEAEGKILEELNRKTHIEQIHPRMLSGHLLGKTLQMFSKMIQPEYILEIGTYTGYSAICLAQGLIKGGVLHTIEKNDELKDTINKYIVKARMLDKIKLHIGDALEIINQLDQKFDLVYIDAEKKEYLDYYNAVFEYVNPGGYIITDNVLWSGKVIEDKKSFDKETLAIFKFNQFVHKDKRVENVLLPVRDGLMILRKKREA